MSQRLPYLNSVSPHALPRVQLSKAPDKDGNCTLWSSPKTQGWGKLLASRGLPYQGQLKITASPFRMIDPVQVPPSDEWAISPCLSLNWGLPGGASSKESTCQGRRLKRLRFNPWVRKIARRREWQPTPVFLPGKSHGPRGLAGYSPWGCKELDMTEQLTKHTHSWIINKNYLSFLPVTLQMLGKQDILYIISALQGLIIWRIIRITKKYSVICMP